MGRSVSGSFASNHWGEPTLKHDEEQEVDVGDPPELLSQVLRTGIISSAPSDPTTRLTLGKKVKSVYLLVRTLFLSYPLGSVAAPSRLTKTTLLSFSLPPLTFFPLLPFSPSCFSCLLALSSASAAAFACVLCLSNNALGSNPSSSSSAVRLVGEVGEVGSSAGRFRVARAKRERRGLREEEVSTLGRPARRLSRRRSSSRIVSWMDSAAVRVTRRPGEVER